jgi:RNA polymerase-associated protein RTF1
MKCPVERPEETDTDKKQSEFNRYKATLQNEGIPFPKKPTLSAKIDDINTLRSRSWSDADLEEKLNRERTLMQKFAPAERNRVANAIEEAKRRGDDAKVSELQEKLDTMETPKLAWKTSLTPTKKTSAGISQQDRLAQLNVENRRRNAEAVRKAQLREKAKAREIEAKVARGEDVNEDTSRRRRTQPKFLLDVNEGTPSATPTKGSTATTPANGTPKLEAKKDVLPHIAKLQQLQLSQDGAKDKKGMPQIHRPLMDDDIIGAIDLDIDVDID